MEELVLAISAEHADALLDGVRDADHRTVPPARLPARAYLAVVGSRTVVGECTLGEKTTQTKDGWTLPVTHARRYRKAKAITEFGLEKIPRSFRYVESGQRRIRR